MRLKKMRSLKHWLYRLRFHTAGWFAMPRRFPVHVDIELAGKCQLACTMCPYGTGTFDAAKQGMMPIAMAYQAVQQAADYGAKSIKFNFRGEPGLYKNLPALVRQAKADGIVETAINTNLTAFTKERLRALCDAGLDLIIISIDGTTKETYEKIRVKGDFNHLIGNMWYLWSLKNRPRIRIQMVSQEANAHEVAGFSQWAEQWTDEVVVQKIRESNEGDRKRCPQPWQRLIVAWDGKVFACCGNWNNEHPVGQFPEQPLSYIWNKSKELQDLRYQATHFNRNPCQDCTVGSSYK